MLFALPRGACASAALAAAVLLAPMRAKAQASDSTLFRAGQWGAEFSPVDFSSLGVLRFSTPTRAWIAQLRGTLELVDRDENTPQTGLRSNHLLQLQLGHRWYKPVAPAVVQHFTLGALARTSRSEFRFRNDPIVRSGNAFGFVADIGAQWMVTSNLSLGASYGIAALVSRNTDNSFSGDSRSTISSAFLGPVSIRAALFF